MHKASEVIDLFFAQYHIDDKTSESHHSFVSICTQWRELVNPCAGDAHIQLYAKDHANVMAKRRYWQRENIANHSIVVDIQHNNLIIGFDHPGWMQKFMFEKKRVLAKLGNIFPELPITNIVCRIITSDALIQLAYSKHNNAKFMH